MNIERFEEYLGIDSTRYNSPTVEALNYYIKHYMLTVPFENIDVQNEVRISLDIDDLFDKVVNRHRGGYCYEMNTLFKAYLLEKGFDPQLMSSTIHTPNGGRSLDGSHVSLVVPMDDQYYIADVGFGDLPLQIIPLSTKEDPKPVEDVTGTFRAIYDKDTNIFYVQKLVDDEWNTQYETTFEAKSIEDFEYNIEYNQTNPNSTFVKRLLITMPKSYGRATMSQDNLTLTKTKQHDKEKYEVTRDNYRQFLKEYFGMDVEIKRLENK